MAWTDEEWEQFVEEEERALGEHERARSDSWDIYESIMEGE